MLTKLRFLKDSPIFDREVPYELFGHPQLNSERITNCEFALVEEVLVEDVRDNPHIFDLENAGFTYVKHHSACPLLAQHFESVGTGVDTDSVAISYLEETIALVKNELSPERAICFDWRFRRSGAPVDVTAEVDDVYDIRLQALAPGLTVHCDFSHNGGMERLEMHLLPEELEAVTSGRWKAKIINVWRPFGEVKNASLVITDRRSVLQEDLVEVEKVLPDKVERAYYLKHRDYHHWYYMSNQSPDDVAIFVTWDNVRGDVVADFPPHGAALQFSDNPFESPRESLEVRLMVFSVSDI